MTTEPLNPPIFEPMELFNLLINASNEMFQLNALFKRISELYDQSDSHLFADMGCKLSRDWANRYSEIADVIDNILSKLNDQE